MTAQELEGRPEGQEPLLDISADDALAQLQSLVSKAESPAEPKPVVETPVVATPPIEPPVTPVKAASAPKEPEPEPPTTDPVLEEIRLQLQEEGIRRERLEAQLAHEKMLRETQSSRAGFYKNVATDLARAIPREQDLPRFEDQGGEQSPEAARFQRELEVLREDAVTRSAQDAMTRFANENPDAADLTENMKPFLTEAAKSYAPWLQSGDPKLVRETSMLVLKSAYLEAKAQKLADQRKAATEKRASQHEALMRNKQAATISGSGGTGPPVTATKPISDYTAEEADAALRKLFPL